MYVEANTVSIKINLAEITLPILWNNNGQYGLIPFARIQNDLEFCKDMGEKNGSMGTYNWHDVIPVSPQIANALLGEDKNDKCTYRGKSSPKSG